VAWTVTTGSVHWNLARYPDPARFLAHCVGDDGLLVVLRRRDRLGRAVGAMTSERRAGGPSARGDTVDPAQAQYVTVDPERLLALLYAFDAEDRWLDEVTESLPQLALTYEDDLVGPAAQRRTLAAVAARLGLGPIVVPEVHPPTDLQADRRRIANLDAVARALHGTRYSAELRL
jgi:hypothetical protein